MDKLKETLRIASLKVEFELHPLSPTSKVWKALTETLSDRDAMLVLFTPNPNFEGRSLINLLGE